MAAKIRIIFQSSNTLQYLRRVVLGVHFGNGLDDDAFLVDDVGGAQRALRHFAVHLLLALSLVGLQYSQVGVGDQMERQAVFGDEVLVRFGAVAADAQHLVAQGQKAFVVVAQVAGLGGAARRAVLGVEIQHQLLAGEVSEFHEVSVLVVPLEVRGFCSFL